MKGGSRGLDLDVLVFSESEYGVRSKLDPISSTLKMEAGYYKLSVLSTTLQRVTAQRSVEY